MQNPFTSLIRTAAMLFLSLVALPSLIAEPPRGIEVSSSVTAAPAAVDLPDAPDPQTQKSPTAPAAGGGQTKRILGIVPNFRAVSSDEILPAQTAKQKFTTVFQDSFDYSALIFAAAQAGIAMAQDSYPEFHQGAAGYGRYLWHTAADQTSENLLVEGIFPVVFHQDNRYYTKGKGGLLKRTAYSFTRTIVTRSDSGHETFNVSEIAGAGASSGIASLYYPTNYRTWNKVGQRWLTSVVIDGATFTVKEFWPDVNRKFFHQTD